MPALVTICGHWKTSKDGTEVLTAQEVKMRQQSDLISVETITRGIEVEEGGYMWRGEFRLWDNEILMGWYVADEGPVRSKGTFYFVLHPHGISLSGHWVGLSYDGKIMSGWGGMGPHRRSSPRSNRRTQDPRR